MDLISQVYSSFFAFWITIKLPALFVNVGPRLFLSCPMDYKDAEMWFTDLWNYSIVPYLLEAVRDEIQVRLSTDFLFLCYSFNV